MVRSALLGTGATGSPPVVARHRRAAHGSALPLVDHPLYASVGCPLGDPRLRQANVAYSRVQRENKQVVRHTLMDVRMGVVPSLLEFEHSHDARVVHDSCSPIRTSTISLSSTGCRCACRTAAAQTNLVHCQCTAAKSAGTTVPITSTATWPSGDICARFIQALLGGADGH